MNEHNEHIKKCKDCAIRVQCMEYYLKGSCWFEVKERMDNEQN